MATSTPPILDRLTALADATRARLLMLLDRHELTVSELCAVVQLPQSTVSRHLKVLADEGWVVSRPDGTSRRYAFAPEIEAISRRLWQVVREQVAAAPVAAHDGRRLEGVLAERRNRSRDFFRDVAGAWDQLRGDLFGRRSDLLALLALLDDRWVVGDLGCGTGSVAESLAPFVARVVAIDDSEAMLESARDRLARFTNVDLRTGALEQLPLEDQSLDAAVLALVLHYLPEPGRALAEAARVLRPGAPLLVIDMMPHDREEYRREMGHEWLGIPEPQLRAWLSAAGFTRITHRPLLPDPAAKGPTLFVAVGRKDDL